MSCLLDLDHQVGAGGLVHGVEIDLDAGLVVKVEAGLADVSERTQEPSFLAGSPAIGPPSGPARATP